MDQFSDRAVLRLQEVLLLETQATVTNGAALEIHLAKAFCYSAIRKPILWVLWHISLVLPPHVNWASLADFLHKQELLPHTGSVSHKCSVCPATSCPEGEKFPDPAKYQHQEHVPRRQGHTAASMCQHSH